MIMSTLALGLADALASAAQPKPKPSLLQRLIAAREEQVSRQVLSYLASMDDQRLAALGFTAEDVGDLRKGELRLPKYE
jgi:hypothetical protein